MVQPIQRQQTDYNELTHHHTVPLSRTGALLPPYDPVLTFQFAKKAPQQFTLVGVLTDHHGAPLQWDYAAGNGERMTITNK